jgi:ubiquinone/menaquinone biosynthesis C-methylase UbiE
LVTAIDINSEYLEILHNRYKDQMYGLEIIEADLDIYQDQNQKYSLIFAGLIFEYLNPKVLLSKVAHWLKDEGVMVSVLQLPEPNIKKVSDTLYPSLKSLKSIMNLLTAQELNKIANECCLGEIEGKKNYFRKW